MALRCGCSGLSNALIWSRSSRAGMLRIVYAGPTRLPQDGAVSRAVPWMYTLRNPRLNSCVHKVAVLTVRSRSMVSDVVIVTPCCSKRPRRPRVEARDASLDLGAVDDARRVAVPGQAVHERPESLEAFRVEPLEVGGRPCAVVHTQVQPWVALRGVDEQGGSLLATLVAACGFA